MSRHLKAISFLILAILAYCGASDIQNKRQGMFGLCQGWGAGCTMNYRSRDTIRTKPTSTNTAQTSPRVRYTAPNYLFTSGTSWNPIGKRMAMYTDIPYLWYPFLLRSDIKIPKGYRKYGLLYQLIHKPSQ